MEILFFVHRVKENRWRCRACVVDYVDRRRKHIKINAVEYMGGECLNCGYNTYVGALEFHHTDPTKKILELVLVHQ